MSPAASRMKMSEYHIPFHIQEEIMIRLPVKSLVQFRSVSKAWKSLIDSSEFIAAHGLRCHTQLHHLLVSYEYWNHWIEIDEYKYVCYVDDHTFPQRSSVPTLPLSVKQLKSPSVVGSSRGLLCLFTYDPGMFVLWNPSIRKSIVVAACNLSVAGFGVCPVTSDPKIVSVTRYWDNLNKEESYCCKVMVYTLSSGKWKTLSTNLSAKRIHYWHSKAVVTDRFIYWDAEARNHNAIISFDVTKESFELIDLPDSLARDKPSALRTKKLRESLAILQYGINICTVWMMEDSVQRSFTKIFTIETTWDSIVAFRKNGIPIRRVNDGHPDYEVPIELVVYEPNSEHNNVIGTLAFDIINVNSYVETLLLLGRSDCDSY